MAHKYLSFRLALLISLLVFIISAEGRKHKDDDDNDVDDVNGEGNRSRPDHHDSGESDKEEENDSVDGKKNSKKDEDEGNYGKKGNDNDFHERCEKLECKKRKKTCCLQTSESCYCKCVGPAISCRLVWPRRHCLFRNIRKCDNRGVYEQCSCVQALVVKKAPPNPETIRKALTALSSIVSSIPGLPGGVRSRVPVAVLNKIISTYLCLRVFPFTIVSYAFLFLIM
ncbi:uncharacterized protein LOC142766048 [Rhipicephalus microplus]|uniref:uncharacterized protein LOC142766048 n=1 Tax=Rhipicephalus microplus TaxID=6941 RepID=UPI003F6C89B6